MLYINLLQQNEVPKSREILKYFHFKVDEIASEKALKIFKDAKKLHDGIKIYVGKCKNEELQERFNIITKTIGIPIDDNIEVLKLTLTDDFCNTLNSNTQILHIDNTKIYFQRFVKTEEIYEPHKTIPNSDIDIVKNIDANYNNEINGIYIDTDDVNNNVIANIYRDSSYGNTKVSIGYLSATVAGIEITIYNSQFNHLTSNDFINIKEIIKGFVKHYKSKL